MALSKGLTLGEESLNKGTLTEKGQPICGDRYTYFEPLPCRSPPAASLNIGGGGGGGGGASSTHKASESVGVSRQHDQYISPPKVEYLKFRRSKLFRVWCRV